MFYLFIMAVDKKLMLNSLNDCATLRSFNGNFLGT
ncbi:hypothetical protein SAMN05216262_102164 [Colwellia chukchiensis]|uniref:Uncharacterized protein n=1 Tax=Colwellia chukchiensis TaxID=641665 RepID=A0A1H7J890_9GAMM|nr:hypothetical protein SAMN05216262_102164 [Colwellia chukchiensis]